MNITKHAEILPFRLKAVYKKIRLFLCVHLAFGKKFAYNIGVYLRRFVFFRTSRFTGYGVSPVSDMGKRP